jgi:hypothetical protein
VGKTITSVGLNSLPIFTGSDSNNIQILKLINGEFSCTPFSETTLAKIYTELSSEIKTVCGASIPSYYGYFSGTISIFFNTKLSDEKEKRIQLLIERISNYIYFQDVMASRGKN